ncbi:MAG: hypothetical protein Q9165_001416 [Trypethelium subeluteriae]
MRICIPAAQKPVTNQSFPLDQDSAINASAYNFAHNPVQVWDCGPGQGYGTPASACCESEQEYLRCCNTATAVFQIASATIGNPSSTDATTTPAGMATAGSVPESVSPTGSSIPTAGPAHIDNSQGVKIGIGIGVPLGAILSAALAVLVWRLRRKEKSRKELEAQLQVVTKGVLEKEPELDGSPKQVPKRVVELGVTTPQELDSGGQKPVSSWRVPELDAGQTSSNQKASGLGDLQKSPSRKWTTSDQKETDSSPTATISP